MRAGRTTLLAAALLVTLGAPASSARGILVACASSLGDLVDTAAAAFADADSSFGIRIHRAASNLLARQIEEGADVDVLLSADRRILERLVGTGAIAAGGIVDIASNRIVAVVPADRLIPVSGPERLVSDDFRAIALADTSVPIGYYASQYLRQDGLLHRLEGRTVREDNARAILAAVASGAADLGFVYATDAASSRAVRVVWAFPADRLPRVTIAGAVLARSREPERARRFLEFLAGEAGRRILQEAGFLPPGDDPR